MADTTNLIAGIAYLSVDGTRYNLVGDLTYSPATVKRESLAGQDTVHGYSETPRASFISGKIRDMGGLSIASLSAMTNVTVTLELANGKTVIGANMWTVEAQQVETGEAACEVRWEGITALQEA